MMMQDLGQVFWWLGWGSLAVVVLIGYLCLVLWSLAEGLAYLRDWAAIEWSIWWDRRRAYREARRRKQLG